MSKRIKQSLGFRILKNTMAAIGVLFVLLGIMAIMMQKGIVKTEWMHFGLIAVCLLTGVLAQLIDLLLYISCKDGRHLCHPTSLPYVRIFAME